jgi:hypothetical protein
VLAVTVDGKKLPSHVILKSNTLLKFGLLYEIHIQAQENGWMDNS